AQTADGAELTATGFRLLGRLDRIMKIEDKRVSRVVALGAVSEAQTADGAELTATGFRLLGRLDRIMKIEDKRVS
ncbi:hypothetical protein CTI14_70025, partial [Methylobacterium radiotolerans]